MDSVKAPTPKVFYFGVMGEKGHRLYDSDGEDVMRVANTPWGYNLDALLCPDGLVLSKDAYQPEGEAMMHHKDGWTALSFWDRSGDHRFNSNSNFMVRGTYMFDEMLALAKEQFPGIFARINFPVVPIGL